MDVIFRKAHDDDRNAIRDIFNYYATHGFAVYRENELDATIFDFFAEDAFAFLVAQERNGSVIGFGALRRYKPAATFDKVGVLTYFLKTENTRAGLGTRFLSELVAVARDLGIRNLLAHISSRNEPSIRFHLKHGFTEAGRLRNIGFKFGRYFDVVWMQKELV
ncbi:MAG: N-acetyltransferase family protein [Planctomycetota bacterium]